MHGTVMRRTIMALRPFPCLQLTRIVAAVIVVCSWQCRPDQLAVRETLLLDRLTSWSGIRGVIHSGATLAHAFAQNLKSGCRDCASQGVRFSLTVPQRGVQDNRQEVVGHDRSGFSVLLVPAARTH